MTRAVLLGELVPPWASAILACGGLITQITAAQLGLQALAEPPAPPKVAVAPEPPAPAPAPARLEPAAAPAPAHNCPEPVTITFGSGKWEPIEVPSVMDVLVAWVGDADDRKLVLDGHADPQGRENKNLRLSHKRARRVGEILIEKGTPAQRLTVRGFGAYVPTIGGEDARRVVISPRSPECED